MQVRVKETNGHNLLESLLYYMLWEHLLGSSTTFRKGPAMFSPPIPLANPESIFLCMNNGKVIPPPNKEGH